MKKNSHRERKRSVLTPGVAVSWGHGAGNQGAATELTVSADLLTRGFAAYRNLSPVGPIDLLAVNEFGEILKVQATTGRLSRTGVRRYDSHEAVPLWDTLAVGYPDGVRYYDRSGTELQLPGKSRRVSERDLESRLEDARVELSLLRAKVTNLEGRLRHDPEFTDEAILTRCSNCVNSRRAVVKSEHPALSVQELFQGYLSEDGSATSPRVPA